jgi:pimeloyl-ACP methyl ester carboxylesterase
LLTPYLISNKISIPDSEVSLLHQKLLLARLPKGLASAKWTEASTNNVTTSLLDSVLQTWLTSYSWREQEVLLNSLPQFTTSISVTGFGELNTHFVHSLSKSSHAVPLLYLHGWPGSILEITKALPLLNEAGFHVVAPSLPGWLSSSTPTEKGFDISKHAECMHNLMLKLGYSKYILQGGDWGGEIAPMLAGMFPDHVLALHVNYFDIVPLPEVTGNENFREFEENSIKIFKHWLKNESAYTQIQGTKPLSLGIGLHDSPIGLLAWITDKLFSWSDCYPKNPKGYRWTNEELITWTLIHYFSNDGPTAPFHMYVENNFGVFEEGNNRKFVDVPTGVSAFRCEAEMVPRMWAEEKANVVWWREHEIGGHFAMYERPEEMVVDIVEFVHSLELRK